MNSKKNKLDVIEYTDEYLSKEKRRSFKEDHPGKRLCFRLRHPNFPIITSIVALLLVIIASFLCDTRL